MAVEDRNLSPAQTTVRLNGSPAYVGTITSGGTSSTTLSAGSLTPGCCYVLEADAKCYFAAQTSSAGTVTTANGKQIAADGDFYVWLKSDQTHIAVISASGTANVKVFKME